MTAFHAIIDRNTSPSVAAYYRMFSTDVSRTCTISIDPSAITELTLTSFEMLVQTLRTQLQRGCKRFLIGSHGLPNEFPYAIIRGAPVLANGTTVTASADLLDELSLVINDHRGARSSVLNREYGPRGERLFRNEERLNNFLKVVKDIRSLGIEHLEFRGCEIGAGNALGAIYRFLGSRYTEAPRILYLWNTARVHICGTPDLLKDEVSRLPPYQRLFTRDDCALPASTTAAGSDLAFIIGIAPDETGLQGTIYAHALNTDAISGWTQRYLEMRVRVVAEGPPAPPPAGGGYRPNDRLPLTGLFMRRGRLPLVFPGDGMQYLEQLVSATA